MSALPVRYPHRIPTNCARLPRNQHQPFGVLSAAPTPNFRMTRSDLSSGTQPPVEMGRGDDRGAGRYVREPDSAGSKGLNGGVALAQASRFEHREMMDGLRSSDKDQQNRAFQGLLQAAQEPLEWAYEIWDELLRTLT